MSDSKMNDFLRVSEFETDEFVALLSSVFSGQYHSPRDGRHFVTWGRDEIIVSFKSGTRAILKVMKGKGATTETIRRLKESVDAALSAAVTTAVATRVLFRWGSTPPYPIRWRDEWQICMLPANAPRPAEEMALFPSLLQFTFRKTGLGWLDAVRQSRRYKEVFLPLVPLFQCKQMGALINPYEEHRKSWVIELVGNRLTNKWLQNSYFLPDGMNVDGFVNELGTHQPRWGDGSAIGTDLNRLGMEPFLLMFEKLTTDQKAKYLAGCYWYHRSLLVDTQTDAFLSLVVMIETFLPHVSAPCEKCGQPVYSISKRFRELLLQYAGPLSADQERVEEFLSFAKDLYALRSGIAHNGRTVAAEHLGFSHGFVPADLHDQDLLRSLKDVGAAFLLGWLGTTARGTPITPVVERPPDRG